MMVTNYTISSKSLPEFMEILDAVDDTKLGASEKILLLEMQNNIKHTIFKNYKHLTSEIG